MADIKKTVEAESVASCTLPEGTVTTVEIAPPTADKIKQIMAALRDPENSIDVHKVAAVTRSKWMHVRDIRDAMRAKVAAAAAPAIIEEK